MKQKKSKIYLRTLQALEQIGRTFTVDELEHVICLKYAEKVDQKLAHSQAAALKSMVRTLYNLFVCVACMFFFLGGFVSYLDWSQVTWCCRQKKRAPNGTRFGMFLAGCPECFLASASYVSRACFLRPNRQWLQQLKAAAGPKLASKKYERKQGQRTGAI